MRRSLGLIFSAVTLASSRSLCCKVIVIVVVPALAFGHQMSPSSGTTNALGNALSWSRQAWYESFGREVAVLAWRGVVGSAVDAAASGAPSACSARSCSPGRASPTGQSKGSIAPEGRGAERVVCEAAK